MPEQGKSRSRSRMEPGKLSKECFVTLVTSDGFVHGATVLRSSVQNTGTERKFIVLVTDQVSKASRASLKNSFDELRLVWLRERKTILCLTFRNVTS